MCYNTGMSLFLKIFKAVVDLFTTGHTSVTTVITETGYNAEEKNMQIERDYKLTDHITLFDMTHTDGVGMQLKNRNISAYLEGMLHATACRMEQVLVLTGKGIHIHSAYRCPELNGEIPGAVSNSQHVKGEACDFDVPGQTPEETHKILHKAMKDGKFWCGQLILEIRGSVKWVHVSQPDPWRDVLKCGQVLLSPKSGVYELIEKVAKPVI